jgi:anti-sigma B factor antagonist
MVAGSSSSSPAPPWGSITCSVAVHPLRVSLCGEVDIALEDSLDAVASFVAHSERSDVAICLHDVTFLDSTGLDFLVRVQEQVRAVGSALRIVAPSPAVRWVLRIAGLLEMFEIEGSGDQPADFCACRSPRIDGVRALVPAQVWLRLEERTGETG